MIGPRDKRGGVDLDDFTTVNTTSRSTTWSVGLSPFLCGPCYLYGTGSNSRFARNVENTWQFSKVYAEHDDNGVPSRKWYKWSTEGFLKQRADRYPNGRGAIPKYTWWDNEALSYIEARMKVYLPVYQQAVRGTEAFYELRKLARKEPIALWDFDGYFDPKVSWMQIVTNEKKKMGHAFVLQMMLMISPFFDLEDLK